MKIGNYLFNGPYDPHKPFVKDFSGVYVIVDDYPRVIDVGQTYSINSRVPNHDRKPCWLRNKSGDIHLYVYEDAKESNRLLIESSLRQLFNPACGLR